MSDDSTRPPGVNEILAHIGEYIQGRIFFIFLSEEPDLLDGGRAFIADSRRVLLRLALTSPLAGDLLKVFDELQFLAEAEQRPTEMLISTWTLLSQLIGPLCKALRTTPDQRNDSTAINDVDRLLVDARELSQKLESTTEDALREAETSLAAFTAASNRLTRRPAFDVRAPKDTKVFVSHSPADKPLAVALCRELNIAGVRTWRRDEDIRVGESIPEQIAKGLETASHFLLLYTPSTQTDPWAQSEIDNAIARHTTKKRPQIVTVTTNGLAPPSLLLNRRSIAFTDYAACVDQLLAAFDVSSHNRITFSHAHRFSRWCERLLKNARWCQQADFFMTIDDETFDELSDVEYLFGAYPLPPELFLSPRFIRTQVCYTSETAELTFDDFFYSFKNSAFGTAYLLRRASWLARRMTQIIELDERIKVAEDAGQAK